MHRIDNKDDHILIYIEKVGVVKFSVSKDYEFKPL